MRISIREIYPRQLKMGKFPDFWALAQVCSPFAQGAFDFSSHPNHDIHTRRSEGAAASAKGFPNADLQVCSVDPGDAAPDFKVSEAQLATFA
jgi:hypothetical protein